MNSSLRHPQIQPANKGIAAITPYQPGKPIDELKRELGIDNIIKLASNENPLGTSKHAIEAMQTALSDISRYPDGFGFELKQALSQTFGVGLAQLTLGNGSNDILELVARTFIAENQSAVYSQHAFAVYALAVQAVGGVGIEVPAKDYGHDLPAMAAAIRPDTRVVFIANPNNPTGTWFDEAVFAQFMAQVPSDVLVVLDEAYVEYFPENFNSIPFLKQYPNLLICRTFSKAYGLAALRVGFAMADEGVTNLLNRVRQPFNVNSLALAAATAAVGDTAFLENSRGLNLAGMHQLEAGLRQLWLDWIPSRANFLCVRVKQDGMGIYQKLLQKGVIVRPVNNYGLPEFIRVSIGLPEENQRFLQTLAEVLGLTPATPETPAAQQVDKMVG